ncbi:MAG: hypothetical protein WD200_01830 [Candidatus Andersenbacteria bacterium]
MAEASNQQPTGPTSQSSLPVGPPPPPVRPAAASEPQPTNEPIRLPVKEVAIQTMKDDLGTASSTFQASAAPSTQGKPLSAPQQPLPSPSSLPLQARNKSEQGVQQPAKKKGSHKGLIIALFLGVLLAIVGTSGWYIWSRFSGESGIAPQSTSTLSAAEMIPEDARVVIRYQFTNPQDRIALQAMWQTSGADSSTPLGDLVAGNPILLLEVQTIQEVMYVLLPDNTRPFMVVPRTAETEQLLTTESGVQVSSVENWIVAHPINAGLYKESLSLGSQAAIGGLPALAGDSHLQFLIQQEELQQLSQAKAFPDVAFLPSQTSIALQGKYDTATNSILFTSGSDFIAGTSTPLKEGFVPLVPAQSTFTQFGTNLQEDIASLSGQKSIDIAVLEQPAVQQFVSQLTTPYVYYRYTSQAGAENAALIIGLPQNTAATLGLGDTAIETGLRALIPLIAGQGSATVPQLAFATGEYRSVPLRYVNLSGQDQAIDYAIINNYLLVASSKDSMFELIDTILGTAPALVNEEPWRTVIAQGGNAVFGGPTIIDNAAATFLSTLLPSNPSGQFPFVVSRQRVGDSVILQGVLSLSDQVAR